MEENELNERQNRFCELYATDREFFGNGVETYLEVYDIDRSKPNWYKTACSAASQLLSNIKVCKKINELLEAGGLNDQFIDKQLGFLITQHSDFTNKLGAIREYNKLKQRITDKIDLTSLGKRIAGVDLDKVLDYVKNEKNESLSKDKGNDEENTGLSGGNIGE